MRGSRRGGGNKKEKPRPVNHSVGLHRGEYGKGVKGPQRNKWKEKPARPSHRKLWRKKRADKKLDRA